MNETITDIIAEKRRRAEEIERVCAEKVKVGVLVSEQFAADVRDLVADIRQEADRLEAAWKREKAAIEADALAVGGLVEASHSTAETSSAVGDAAHRRELSKNMSKNGVDFGQLGAAAKLREAAEKVVEITKREWDAFRETAAMGEMHKICKDALAAPRKNCERFQTWDEAKDAYWREQGDPCDWRKLGAWFFAPEGGVNV